MSSNLPAGRKFAAVMFTDIVGFSRLAGRNEALALDLLEEHEALVRRHLPGFAGREVKTVGDAFMLEFASPVSAVRCALRIQAAMRERNESVGEGRRLLLRIGIHAGDVVERDGDLYGDGVNIAARVEPMSPAGGVAVSGQVHDLVSGELDDLAFRKLPPRPLKNIERRIDLFVVVMPWETGDAAAAPGADPAAAMPAGGDPARAAGTKSIADLWFEESADEGEAGPGWGDELPEAGPRRVAILPLENAGGDPGDAFIAEGLSEELLTAVSCVGGLDVMAWDSVAGYPGRGADIAAVAEVLHAGTVIRGGAAITGGKAVLDIECLAGDGLTVHWKKQFGEDLRTMTAVWVEVARATAAVAGVEVQEGEVSRMSRAATENPQAGILYLRALRALADGSGGDDAGARDLFGQALERDADFAFAHIGLVESFLRMGLSGRFPPNRMLMHIVPGALHAGRRAVECGRFLAEAHAAQGLARLGFTYDVVGAASELKQACDLKDGFAGAHAWHAIALAVMGRFDECETDLKRARELDPASPVPPAAAAFVWYLARRARRAVAAARAGLDAHPDSWLLHALLGLGRESLGEVEGAVEALRRAEQLSDRHPLVTAALGAVLGRAGRTDEARAVLRELEETAARRFVPAYARALVLAGLGDAADACARLEEAHDEQLNWLVFLNLTPLFDPLRGDLAYAALIERTGLVPGN